jgi:hypothetical protein
MRNIDFYSQSKVSIRYVLSKFQASRVSQSGFHACSILVKKKKKKKNVTAFLLLLNISINLPICTTSQHLQSHWTENKFWIYKIL